MVDESSLPHEPVVGTSEGRVERNTGVRHFVGGFAHGTNCHADPSVEFHQCRHWSFGPH